MTRENNTAEIGYKTRRYLKYIYDKGTATGLTFLEGVTGFQHSTKKHALCLGATLRSSRGSPCVHK
jgi:hypothetical protein